MYRPNGTCIYVLINTDPPDRASNHFRAFAEFALGSIVLHFFVYNFLG